MVVIPAIHMGKACPRTAIRGRESNLAWLDGRPIWIGSPMSLGDDGLKLFYNFSPSGDGVGERYLVGVLELGAHGEAAGEAGEADGIVLERAG